MSDVRVYCTEQEKIVDPYDNHHCQEGVHMESHPEDFCDECHSPNPNWVVDSDRFNTAMAAIERDRGAIVCPGCFIAAHERATGLTCTWSLVPATPFRWLEDLTKEDNDE